MVKKEYELYVVDDTVCAMSNVDLARMLRIEARYEIWSLPGRPGFEVTGERITWDDLHKIHGAHPIKSFFSFPSLSDIESFLSETNETIGEYVLCFAPRYDDVVCGTEIEACVISRFLWFPNEGSLLEYRLKDDEGYHHWWNQFPHEKD